MGKKCDLCGGVARMYCESDEASLCWDCDGKVHGANFLVAKHTRCLLCSACQSLTPWKATGLRLSPTFSVCDSCVALKNASGGTDRILSEIRSHEIDGEDLIREEDDEEDGAESYDDDEDEDEDEEYSEEDDDEVEDEEAENQVVPWTQPPPVMSSSSSDGDLVTKRSRDCSDDEIGSSSGQESNYSRPLKRLLKSTAVN